MLVGPGHLSPSQLPGPWTSVGQAPLAIEDGQPDAAGETTEDDLEEARVDKLVAEHLNSQFRYKPLVAAHMNHILACKKCCGTSKFGTHNVSAAKRVSGSILLNFGLRI